MPSDDTRSFLVNVRAFPTVSGEHVTRRQRQEVLDYFLFLILPVPDPAIADQDLRAELVLRRHSTHPASTQRQVRQVEQAAGYVARRRSGSRR